MRKQENKKCLKLLWCTGFISLKNLGAVYIAIVIFLGSLPFVIGDEFVYVSNYLDSSISRINITNNNNTEESASVDYKYNWPPANQYWDGEFLWVSDTDSGYIISINLSAWPPSVTGRLLNPAQYVQLTPDRTRLYAVDHNNDVLYVINATFNASNQPDLSILASIQYNTTTPLSTYPCDISITPDGKYAVTPERDRGDNDKKGSLVTFINISKVEELISENYPSTVDVSVSEVAAVRVNLSNSTHNLGNVGPHKLTVSPWYNYKHVFVENIGDNTESIINYTDPNPDNWAEIAVINLGSFTPSTSEFTPDGNYAYISQVGGTPKKIIVIDLANLSVYVNISSDVLDGGQDVITFSQDGNYAYASMPAVDKVLAISTSNHSVMGTILVGNQPYGALASPPHRYSDTAPPKVTLNYPPDGQYFTSNDNIFFNVTVTDSASDWYWNNENTSNVTLRFSGDGISWYITNTSGMSGTYIFNISYLDIPHGTYTWYVQAFDNSSNEGLSPNRTFTYGEDILPPQITINSPTNGTFISDNTPTLNATEVEDNPDTMWYSLDSGSNYTSAINTTAFEVNLPKSWVVDSGGDAWNDSVIFDNTTIDVNGDIIISSTIQLQEDETENMDDAVVASDDGPQSDDLEVGDFANIERSWIKFNLSSIPNDATITSAKVYLYAYYNENPGFGISVHFSPNDTWVEEDLDPALGGAWTNQPIFNATPIENVSAFNETNIWKNWTVTQDVINEYNGDKIITLVFKGENEPETGSGVYIFRDAEYTVDLTKRPYLNVTYRYFTGNLTSNPKDAGIHSFWKQIKFDGNVTAGTNVSIYVNTSSDNSNWTGYQLVKENATCGEIYDLNITNQERFAVWRLKLTTNDTSLTPVVQSVTMIATLSEGKHNVTVYANDTLGNNNSKTSVFTVDTILPVVNITAPSDNTTYDYSNLTLNFTYNETNIDACWYNLNNTTVNTTIACQSETAIKAMVGSNVLVLYINDSAGNIGYDVVYFNVTKDTSPPIITIYSPQNITYETTTIDLNVSADEGNITWRYSLNSGTNTTFIPNTTITGIQGSNNLVVYANDTGGNVNSSTVWFIINITPQEIITPSPTGGGYKPVLRSSNATIIVTPEDIDELIRELSLMTNQFYVVKPELAGVLGALDYMPTSQNLSEKVDKETWKPVKTLEGDVYTLASEQVLTKFDKADKVIISRGDLGVDSIAGVAYARVLEVPILLVEPESIPQVTNDTLKMLGTNYTIILGGPDAVSKDVEAQLPALITRIGGKDRFYTAVKIALALMRETKVDTIVVTDGRNPDITSIMVAVKYNAPIVYVDGDEVPDVTKEFFVIKPKIVEKIILVGVSDKAREKLSPFLP